MIGFTLYKHYFKLNFLFLFSDRHVGLPVGNLLNKLFVKPLPIVLNVLPQYTHTHVKALV